MVVFERAVAVPVGAMEKAGLIWPDGCETACELFCYDDHLFFPP